MTDEDRVAHDAFSAAMIASMAPEGALETQLAQRVATDSWRLNRSSAIEDNLFAIGFSDHSNEITAEHPQVHAAFVAARVFTVESKHLELLTLYEQRINRSLQKNLSLLQSLQATRKEARRHEIMDAQKLLQLSEMKGLPYDPAKAQRALSRAAIQQRTTPPARRERDPFCACSLEDGFVFSNDHIHAAVDRERRLDQAWNTDFTRLKSRKHHAQAA